MNEIWVIGTDPPCPRCALVTLRVEGVLKEMGIDLQVRHLSFDDPTAEVFAASLGLEVGTAKDVARVSGLEMDFDAISGIIAKQWMSVAKRLECPLEDVPPADRWSPELDVALLPFEEKKKRINFMMTPVLIVDGEVKHQGSVPSIEQIMEILEPLRVAQSHRNI